MLGDICVRKCVQPLEPLLGRQDGRREIAGQIG